jgi:predicted RNase H-like HicB family nuclease
VTDYIDVVDESKGVWGVRVPDLPGCYGAGASAEDAIRDAASAAREWIAHQIGAEKACLRRERPPQFSRPAIWMSLPERRRSHSRSDRRWRRRASQSDIRRWSFARN